MLKWYCHWRKSCLINYVRKEDEDNEHSEEFKPVYFAQRKQSDLMLKMSYNVRLVGIVLTSEIDDWTIHLVSPSILWLVDSVVKKQNVLMEYYYP